jgi:hypothetical protein
VPSLYDSAFFISFSQSAPPFRFTKLRALDMSAAAAAASSAQWCHAPLPRSSRGTRRRRGVITRAKATEYPPFDPDFVPPPPKPDDYVDQFCRFMNASFKSVTTQWVKDKVKMRPASAVSRDLAEAGPFSEAAWPVLTSPPESPGVPRGVSLTILGSVPTALGWYGFYTFSVEEVRRGFAGGEGDYVYTLRALLHVCVLYSWATTSDTFLIIAYRTHIQRCLAFPSRLSSLTPRRYDSCTSIK